MDSADVWVNDNSSGAVLRAVLELGSAPRSTVAGHAGLSPATVSAQSRSLIEAGLLVELPDTRSGGMGRPFVPLALDAERNVALALHIAAHRSTIAVVDIAGRLVHRCRIAHTSDDPEDVLEMAAEKITRARQLLPATSRVVGLGVATGGWVDSAAGVVRHHPTLGWAGVPVREILSARTGVRTQIDSHARALVHAEYLYGRQRGASSTIVLFVGNVIDSAFAVHGQVHYGQRAAAGSVAGLVADIHGAPALHAYSDAELAARAARAGIVSEPDMELLLTEAARPGSPARTLLVERARALGRVAAALIDLLNPDSFIIVDRAAHMPEIVAAYRDSVRRHSVTDADADAVVGSSFSGWVLPAAAAAVVLWELYAAPLAVVQSTALQDNNFDSQLF